MGWARLPAGTRPDGLTGSCFPRMLPAPTVVIAELQALNVGDFVPDGVPQTKTGFIVEELIPTARSSCIRRAICREAGARATARFSIGRARSF